MTHFSRARLNYIRPDHLSETQDRITFEETDAAGRATITFVAQKPCLRVKPAKRHPVSWSRHQKCADGAIIEFKNQTSVLHIVELKKHINTGNWGDAKKQFAGMLVNALALGGALGVGEFNEVIAYVAFQRDDLTATETSSTISLKSETGTGKRLLPDGDDWREGKLDLLHFPKVSLVKIQLDDEAHATHPL